MIERKTNEYTRNFFVIDDIRHVAFACGNLKNTHVFEADVFDFEQLSQTAPLDETFVRKSFEFAYGEPKEEIATCGHTGKKCMSQTCNHDCKGCRGELIHTLSFEVGMQEGPVLHYTDEKVRLLEYESGGPLKNFEYWEGDEAYQLSQRPRSQGARERGRSNLVADEVLDGEDGVGDASFVL